MGSIDERGDLVTNSHHQSRILGNSPPPGFSIRTPRGLLRVDRSFPSLAATGWAATTWSTAAGAARAIARSRTYLTTPPLGAAAGDALALLDGAIVLPHDLAAEVWHDGLRATRHRVDQLRRELLGGLGAVVDAAGFIGPGATVDGVLVTADMAAARIEREIASILEEGARDTELAHGWLTEAGLVAWVVQRQQRARR